MSESFFGHSMTLDVSDPDGGEVPVAGLQTVEFVLEAEHVELFTADSINWDTVKKREARVPIEIELAKFDEAFAQWWMGVDEASPALEDTSDVAFFEIGGTITSTDGSLEIEVAIEDVYFESLPLWEASQGEFIVQSLSGVGKTVTNFDVVV